MDAIGDKKALRVLVHKLALNEVGWRDGVLQAFVETALFYSPSYKLEDAQDICRFIKKELKLQFDTAEIQDAVDILIRKHFIKTIDGLTLDEGRVGIILRQIQEVNDLEDTAKREWLLLLRSKYTDVSEAKLEPLWLELVNCFIGPLFLRLGAECFYLIGQQHHTIPQAYVELPMKCAAKYSDPQIKGLIQREFPDFFANITAIKRQYLMHFLDYSLAQYSVGLDKKLLDSTYRNPPEFVLFLDTNFLYSLCELSEPAFVETAQSLVTTAGQLKDKVSVKFYFTDVTQSEYIRTIDSAIIILSGVNWSPEVSRAALKAGGLVGLTKPYHTRNASRSVTPEIFYSQYRSPVPLFKQMGVNIFNEKFLELKQDQSVIDDIFSFRDYLKKRGEPRQWETTEHDVILWHIARRKRSTTDSFADAKYFVLTNDMRLTRFDAFKQRQLGFKTPICIFPNHFLQVLRFFIPRSDDFETTFLHSLRIPLARTESPETERITMKILQILGLYGDMPEAVACDILTDQTLANEVKRVVDERDKIVELVDRSLTAKLRSLQEERGQLATEKDAVMRDKAGLESTVSRLEQALQQNTSDTKRILAERDSAISALENKMEATRQMLVEREEAISRLKSRVDEITTEAKTRTTRRSARMKQVRLFTYSLSILMVFLIVALLAAFFLSRVFTFAPIKSHSYYVILTALALIAWYNSTNRIGLRTTTFWTQTQGKIKTIGWILIGLGGLWQGIEIVLRVFFLL